MSGLTKSLLTAARGWLLLFTACIPAAVSAGTPWDWGLRTGITARYDDNPTLRSEDELFGEQEIDSTFAILASADLELQQRKDNRTINISPRVTRDYYTDSDNSDLESTDYDIPLTITWADPRFSRGISASYQERSILSDDNTILDDGGGTANRLRADDKLTTYFFNANANWAITPRDSVTVLGGYGKNDYDLDFTGRADSDNYQGGINYSRNVTERLSLGAGASYRKFDSESNQCTDVPIDSAAPSSDPCGRLRIVVDNTTGEEFIFRSANTTNTNTTENTDYSINLNYALTPTSEFFASVGTGRTETEIEAKDANGDFVIIAGQPFSSKTSNKSDTYRVSYSKDFERGDIQIEASRAVRPSPDGSARDNDQLSFQGDYQLTERVNLNLLLRGNKSENVLRDEVSNTSLVPTRKNFLGQFTAAWRWTENWTIRATYKYRWRENESLQTEAVLDDNGLPVIGDDGQPVLRSSLEGFDADGNAYNLGIFYTFKRLQ